MYGILVGYDTFMTLNILKVVFYVPTPCCLVDGYQRFGGIYRFRL